MAFVPTLLAESGTITRKARIVYNAVAQEIRVYVANTLSETYQLVLTQPLSTLGINFAADVLDSNGKAYIGFTASTKLAKSLHKIISWEFKPVPSTPSVNGDTVACSAKVIGLSMSVARTAVASPMQA